MPLVQDPGVYFKHKEAYFQSGRVTPNFRVHSFVEKKEKRDDEIARIKIYFPALLSLSSLLPILKLNRHAVRYQHGRQQQVLCLPIKKKSKTRPSNNCE